MTCASPCDDCIAGCCRETHLLVTGHDVYRITSALHIPPSDFVSLRGRDACEGEFKIRLSPQSTRHHRLEMRKIDESGGDWARRCVFLLTVGSRGRCGIYHERPVQCALYPYYNDERDRLVILRHRPYCPPGSWASFPVDEPHHSALDKQKHAERNGFNEFIDEWNVSLEKRGPASEADFLDHLIRVYGSLLAGSAPPSMLDILHEQ